MHEAFDERRFQPQLLRIRDVLPRAPATRSDTRLSVNAEVRASWNLSMR
jgi:hypothetical protein